MLPTLVLAAPFAFAPLAPTWVLVLAQLLGRPILQDTIFLRLPAQTHILIGSAVEGYVLSYILGIPACLVLRRLRWIRWYAYLGCAFIAGAASASLVLLWVTRHDPAWPIADVRLITFESSISVSVYAIGLVIGALMALTGLLFWLIARPDRSSGKAPQGLSAA